MDYHWNDIRTEFSDAQNSTLPEKDFQSRINSIFKYYLRWGNNIVSEESIHIGSANPFVLTLFCMKMVLLRL